MAVAYFADTHFEKTDGRVTPLQKGEYEQCTFTNCDFAEADLAGIRFVDCRFDGCNLSLAKVNKTAFREVAFSNCKMLGLRFDACDAFGLSFSFEGCVLDHSSFYKVKALKTRFKNTQLHEVDLTECDLSGSVFTDCDLAGATFDNTNIEKADLRTAYNYALDPERNRMKKALFAMTGLPGLLGKYGIVVE